MPVPSAAFILSMLKQYHPRGSEGAVALGNLGARNAETKQRGDLARADDQRARDYMAQQQGQFDTAQQADQRDQQIKAYTAFQAAVDSGDVEQAGLAANTLRMLGVDVQEYGAGDQGPTGSSSMAAMARQSPTAQIDQARAQQTPESFDPGDTYGDKSKTQAPAAPMPPAPAEDYDPEADAEEAQNDALIKQWETEPASGTEEEAARQEFIFNANAQKQKRTGAETPAPPEQPGLESRLRPGPSRAGGLPGTPVEQSGSEETASAEMGGRPDPSRSSFIKGQEPGSLGGSPMRGYRLNFGGKVIDIDPESVAQRQRDRVAGAMRPLLISAQTPDEKRAAAAAIELAVESVGPYSPDKAMQLGLGLYNDTLDRSAKEKRAKIVSGNAGGPAYGGGPVGEDTHERSLEIGKYANPIIEKVMEKYDVKGMRKQLIQTEDQLTKANSPNALSQYASKRALMMALDRGALSDRDVRMMEGAAGNWNALETWVNRWTEGGAIPDDILRQIKAIAAAKADKLRSDIGEIGKAAKQRILNDPTLREVATPEELEDWGDSAFGAATGVFREPKPKAGKGAPARKAPGKKPAARVADPNAEADDILE